MTDVNAKVPTYITTPKGVDSYEVALTDLKSAFRSIYPKAPVEYIHQLRKDVIAGGTVRIHDVATATTVFLGNDAKEMADKEFKKSTQLQVVK